MTPSPVIRLDIGRRALAMTSDDAALLITLAHEPELIMQPGERAPVIPPEVIAAAELRAAWDLAEQLNNPAFRAAFEAGERLQAELNRRS